MPQAVTRTRNKTKGHFIKPLLRLPLSDFPQYRSLAVDRFRPSIFKE
ncbi:hypothetical protein MTY_0022 [Moorella thermoacetica Y72]|uniref:Uncharacterized protein n=1 Tax=Moorella thermoacetica Y72 TaxID=1325331 RepID=A0A0S6U6D3_NEOTH|nr:hypothetical protein MTY_0022 [Moorella thermoacetica Y72]